MMKQRMIAVFLLLLTGVFGLWSMAAAVPLQNGPAADPRDLAAPEIHQGEGRSRLDNAGKPLPVDELGIGGEGARVGQNTDYIKDLGKNLPQPDEGAVSFKHDQRQTSAFVLSREAIRELGQERWEETRVSRINLAFFLISVLVVFSIAALFFLSRHTFDLISKNCRRLDGTTSANRVSDEIRHILVISWRLLLFAGLYAGLLGTAVWLVDTAVIPLEFLGRIFAVFDLNPIAWEFAIRERVFNDVGTLYEAWCQVRGYSSKTYTFLLELLWRNGFLLLAMTTMALLTASGLGLFLIRQVIFRLNTFQENAERRRFRYDRYDRKQVIRAAQEGK